VNGCRSNYETDLFTPLLAHTAALTKREITSAADLASLRVIADHARTTAFLIADGVSPTRLAASMRCAGSFRRAVRHGERLIIGEPFMHRARPWRRDRRLPELSGPP
jgi:alanyl-tRNA synthetase